MVRSHNKYFLGFLNCLVLLLPFSMAGQKASGNLLEDYDTYFEQGRETIFLDLPKETFYTNEPIPFAGYVLEAKTHLPALATTNVYTAIYDSLGVLIEQGLFYTKAGTFRGQLKLPDSLSTGTYYIKAYTNWMNNFDPQLIPVRNIRRIDSISTGAPSNLVSEQRIRFYPEGGSLVEEVDNTVGFYYEPGSKTNAKVISCRLLDQWGVPVLEGININTHGYGKFRLKPKQGAQYLLEIVPDSGPSFKAKLPEPMAKGAAISINALPEEDIVVQVNTRDLELDGVLLALHRDGNLKVFEFEMKGNRQSFRIPKEQALYGLNKLSVFDPEQRLLAERIFYNHKDGPSREPKIELGQARQLGDSIDLPISLINVPSGNIARLSLAVLPIETKARGSLSIKRWFELQSYFDLSSNRIPYATPNERGVFYDLDLFLLSNHWNRYDWQDLLAGPPKTDHAFQSGIGLYGFIRGDSKARGKSLIAYQKSVGQYYTAEVGNNLQFQFEDLYLVKQEPIQFFLEGTELDPKADIKLEYQPAFKTDYLSYERRQPRLSSSRIQQARRFSDNRPSFPAATVLDEVLLSVKKEPQLSRNESLSGGVYDGVKMTPEEAAKSIRLSNYLRKLGFQVRLIPQLGKVGVFAKSAQDDPPIVYVDGFRTGNYVDDLLLSNVDEIYYEHYGLEGSDGGSLYIYQNYGQQQNKERFLQKIAEVGFSSKQFERDFRLTPFARRTFLEYGLVHWEDHLILTSGEQKQLRFPAYGLKDFKIFINGVTDKGGLISDEIDVLLED